MSHPQDWLDLYSAPCISAYVSIARLPFDIARLANILLYWDFRLSMHATPTTCKIDWTYGILEEQGDGGELAIARYRWGHVINSHGSGEPPDEDNLIRRIKEDGSKIEEVGLDPETGKIGPYEVRYSASVYDISPTPEVANDHEHYLSMKGRGTTGRNTLCFFMSGPSLCASTELST
ncbi:hypothetical protein V8B97DRAFT_1952923 [Scleroderma yunnanense]